MREVLVALDIQAFAAGEAVLLAMPVGGGQVVALTPEAARNGYYEGWLDGWKPDDAPFVKAPSDESELTTERRGRA